MIPKSMFKKPIEGNERRGVAPIIATLLMVAIAVVGGILIFVFAQGFFNQSDVSAPTSDSLVVFGFDARDREELTTHAGDDIAASDTDPSGNLADSDVYFIYVRNTGSQALTVQKLIVAGEDYEFDADFTEEIIDWASAIPTPGMFLIITDGVDTASESQEIKSGEEATLVVAYDGDIGDINSGRQFKTGILTGSGTLFTATITAGVQRGA
jgi:flagellin-like protein